MSTLLSRSVGLLALVGAGASPEVLERRLKAMLQAGWAAWPGLDLPAASYVDYLAERIPRGPDPDSALGALHAEDLYLACACARSVRGAGDVRAQLDPQVAPYVRRVDSSPAFLDEVQQFLRDKLFVSADGSPPTVTKYSGRSSTFSPARRSASRTPDIPPADPRCIRTLVLVVFDNYKW